MSKPQTLHIAADSISMHYGPYLKELLDGHYVVDRKPEESGGVRHETGTNGGDSSQLLAYLRICKQTNERWDCMILNAGLHDIRRRSGTLQVEATLYESNLDEILNLAAELSTRSIWALTTPVADDHHNSLKEDYWRFDEDVQLVNEIALRVCDSKKVDVVDLYGLTSWIGVDERQLDHVHYTHEVRKLQAAFVAGFLHR